MKMKKTWLSYLLWLLFTAEAIFLSAVSLSAASGNWGITDEYERILLSCMILAAAAAVWFLGHKIAGIWAEKPFWDTDSGRLLECFLAMCLFAAAILYRIQLRRMSVPEASIYYDMATIKSTGGVPEIAHGASYCYTVILSAVLSFSGNKPEAGMVLQFFFQLLSLLLLYFGVRRLAGRTEALCVMAVMAFLPVYASQIYSLTPGVFYFFLYASGIFGIGLCRRAKEGNGKSIYAAFLLTGICIGIIGYLDMLGFSLLFLAGGMCMEEAAGEERKADKSAGFGFLLCLLGAFAGAFCCLAMDAALLGSSLQDTWNVWTDAALWGGNFRLPSGPDRSPAVSAMLCFPGLLGGIGFWFHREQKQDVWILYLLTATVLDMISTGTFTYTIFIAFGWAVLAGIGINSMRNIEDSKKDLKTAVPEIVLEDMDQMEEEEEKDEKPKVQLIENPLPLPKKHVRREMDFDRIVEYNKMKFDIEVDETDDFDI